MKDCQSCSRVLNFSCNVSDELDRFGSSWMIFSSIDERERRGGGVEEFYPTFSVRGIDYDYL